VLVAVAMMAGILTGPSSIQASGHKNFKTGTSLVDDMREWEKHERGVKASWTRQGIFAGYVEGVYDAHRDAFCAGEQVDVRQLCSVVAKYLNAHPETWDHPAERAVGTAFHEAFPCK
jgi:hypothetical protein